MPLLQIYISDHFKRQILVVNLLGERINVNLLFINNKDKS